MEQQNNIPGCPICDAEPEAYETAFGATIRHRSDNHECAAFGDTMEEALAEWCRGRAMEDE